MKRDRWRWRTPDPEANAALGLCYEPGNWGDLLKALWVVETTDALLASSDGPLAAADLFAGAPAYPVLPAARARLASLRRAGAPWAPTRALLEDAAASGSWPGAGALLLATCARRNRDGQLLVGEADPGRRRAWSAVAQAELLDGDDSWALLRDGAAERRSQALVLIDPYDLDKRWREVVPAIGRLAAGGATQLLYLYNRGPRGPNALADYERLLEALAAAGCPPLLRGRLPADARLPRAFHELLLLPAAGAPLPGRLLDRLAAATASLAAELAVAGSVERGPAVEPGGAG